jgi:hypothetical protein
VSLRLRILGVLCVLVSLALLYPGISKPVLTLSGELEKAALADFGIDLLAGESDNGQAREMLTMLSRFMGLDHLEGRIEAYRNTRSILGLYEELSASGNVAVAFLILTFSVIVPVIKLLMQLVALLLPNAAGRALLALNAALSKWSMADVFVMAMLIAFLAGRASEGVGQLLVMDARLEVGFWYFVAYCFFAIAAGALLGLVARREAEASRQAVQSVPDRETL